MIIRCWGARGSIPVSGEEYVRYGGSTTCVEIRTGDDEVIIIDAGTGIRKLGNNLIKEEKFEYNIIFTHAHWDHIIGLPYFKPVYKKDHFIHMYGCSFAQASIDKIISKTMEAPYFPVSYGDIQAKIISHNTSENGIMIGSLEVSSIPLSHPNMGLGYKFVEDGKVFVFITDNELSFKHRGGLDFQDYLKFSIGADLLIHDAEYTEEDYKITKRWGHSVYKDALKLALEADVKKFGLFHHNQERTDLQVDEIVRDCFSIADEKGMSLDCFAISEGMEIVL